MHTNLFIYNHKTTLTLIIDQGFLLLDMCYRLHFLITCISESLHIS